MKLNAKDVIPFHRRRKPPAILAACDRRLSDRSTKGMREINERGRRHTAQQPRGQVNLKLVPSNMGRLHARRKALALAVQQAQPWSLRRFLTALKHPLHPDADSKERHSAFDCIRNRIL